MWRILEHREIEKVCRRLPQEVVKKYELWKDIVFRHGPEKLREFPGFHDEKLKGTRKAERSSRLNLQYHVIDRVERKQVMVFVIAVSPHVY